MNQGTEWGLLMKKKKSQKSRASVPLKWAGFVLAFGVQECFSIIVALSM
jgi:hypothetical protein